MRTRLPTFSRRGLAAGLSAVGFGSLPGAGPWSEAARARKRKKKCKRGKKRCGKTCVVLASDTRHCGRCGNACGPNAICDEGVCRPCRVCATGCEFTSVQAAIEAAEAGETIAICPGSYTDRTGSQEAFWVGSELTLVGGANTILEAKGGRRVISVASGADLTLRNLTLTGGDANSGGGGLDVLFGSVTLDRCTVRDNRTLSSGGGINNREGTVIVNGGSIRGNRASVGGGIANTGELVLNDGAVVSGNIVTGSPILFGGGIANEGEGTVTLNGGSRVTGNSPDNCIFTPACRS